MRSAPGSLVPVLLLERVICVPVSGLPLLHGVGRMLGHASLSVQLCLFRVESCAALVLGRVVGVHVSLAIRAGRAVGGSARVMKGSTFVVVGRARVMMRGETAEVVSCGRFFWIPLVCRCIGVGSVASPARDRSPLISVHCCKAVVVVRCHRFVSRVDVWQPRSAAVRVLVQSPCLESSRTESLPRAAKQGRAVATFTAGQFATSLIRPLRSAPLRQLSPRLRGAHADSPPFTRRCQRRASSARWHACCNVCWI